MRLQSFGVPDPKTGIETASDRLSQQLKALGVRSYDLATRLDENKAWNPCGTFSPDELIGQVGKLRRLNSQGLSIHIRPVDPHGLIFLDDLNRASLDRLKADGLEPCCIVRTSDDNYQAWVKLGNNVDPDTREKATDLLAKRYNGDLRAKGPNHFGRAAGFANKKRIRTLDNGHSPWVFLDGHNGRIASRAEEIITEARAQTSEAKWKGQVGVRCATPTMDVHIAWELHAERLEGSCGPADDESKRDYAIALALLERGYSTNQVIEALNASLDRNHRKKSKNYAQTTVENADKNNKFK